jgi:hypothetical protein
LRAARDARSIGAEMKRHAALLLANLLAASIVQAADAAPKALLDKLIALAGAGSRDCGTVMFGDDPGVAISCAEDAGASGKSYRLAIEFEGPDGLVWQGAARDQRGRLWSVYFDSDPSAPAGTGDTLSVVPCSRLTFATKGDDVIRCQPILGGH